MSGSSNRIQNRYRSDRGRSAREIMVALKGQGLLITERVESLLVELIGILPHTDEMPSKVVTTKIDGNTPILHRWWDLNQIDAVSCVGGPMTGRQPRDNLRDEIANDPEVVALFWKILPDLVNAFSVNERERGRKELEKLGYVRTSLGRWELKK